MTTSARHGREDGGHVRSLDALRGIAASVVLVRHTLEAIALPSATRRALNEGLPALLLNAQGAVQLFFVLSGWVLARSLAGSHDPLGVLTFWIKRIFRIHPPYVFAVLFAWAASHLYVPLDAQHGVTRWFTWASRARLSPSQLPGTLVFPGEAYGLLWVGWTLRVEMIFSLLLPVLFVAARLGGGLPLLLACTALLGVDVGVDWAWYAIDFALGLVAFQERKRLDGWLGGAPRLLGALVAAVGLALLALPHWLRWSPPGAGIVVGGKLPLAILVMGLGSVTVVAAAVSAPSVRRGLSISPLLFLGRISFSLYLLHLAWISLLVPRLIRTGSLGNVGVIVVVVFVASVASATLSERWIERPSIVCGRALCARVVRALGGRSVPGSSRAR